MNCPVCGYNSNNLFLESKDYFLTKQAFNIHKCDRCSLLFTTPRPAPDELPAYYESPEYLSHKTETKNLRSVIYGIIRKFNISHKYKIIQKLSNTGNILDYGCGTGDFLKTCRNYGWKVSGIETNEKARNFAAGQNKIDAFPENYIKQFNEESFDLITLWHVLEHIPDLNDRLDDFYKLLKPGGILLLAVPNSDSWDASHYKNLWAAWDLPRHLYHFNYNSLKSILTNHQFNFVKSIPMKLDAFYICLLSEQYRKNKFPFPAAFVNGLKSNCHAKRNNENYSSIISVFKKG